MPSGAELLHSLAADPGGPERYGSLRALCMTAELVRQDVSPGLAGHLTSFALPLAARRWLDAAAFMHEASNTRASALLEREARLFGEAQYPAAQGHWNTVAGMLDELVSVGHELLTSI